MRYITNAPAARVGRACRNDRGRSMYGFTLIEILVVVAIIALLISILLPSLAVARETSRRVMCGTQLAEMTKGLTMYHGENKDFLPGPIHAGLELETVDKIASYDHETWHLPSFLRKYFSDAGRKGKLTDRVIKCPTADKLGGTVNRWGANEAMRPFTYALNNWAASSAANRPGTVPERYFGWPDTFWTSGSSSTGRFIARVDAPDDSKPKRMGQIPQPGREWAIGDAFRYTDDNRPPLRPGKKHGDWRLGTYQSDWAVEIPTSPYHDKGINVALFDGHIEYQRPWRGSVNHPR